MDKDLPVCVVGYALNPKKLRKSAKKTSDAAESTSIEASSSSTPYTSQDTNFKWRGGGLSDILAAPIVDTELYPVRFVPWDYEKPLDEQPKFNVLIHKLTEDIDRPESQPKISALDDYLNRHPDTVLVDPVCAVRKVISRERTCAHLANVYRALGEKCPFRLPNYVVIKDASLNGQETLKMISEHNIQFPIICKPIEACGTPISHKMAVIVSTSDIGLLQKPCVVQQYHNHNATLYKVYVIGEDVMVFCRSSLPNLDVCGQDDAPECRESTPVRGQPHCVTDLYRPPARDRQLHSLVFDSRKSYPTLADFQTPSSEFSSCFELDANNIFTSITSTSSVASTSNSSCNRCGTLDTTHFDKNPAPALAHVTTPSHPKCSHVAPRNDFQDDFCYAAKLIQKELGLSLFGFDVIVPTRSGRKRTEFSRCSSDPNSPARCSLVTDACGGHQHTGLTFTGPGASECDTEIHAGRGAGGGGVAELKVTDTDTDTEEAVVVDGGEQIEIAEVVPSRSMAVAAEEEEKEQKEEKEVQGNQPRFANEMKRTQGQSLTSTTSDSDSSHEGRLVVIDVNYFPSYKEVSDFPQRLRKLLHSRMALNR